MANASDIEKSKENVQPITSGRKPQALLRALEAVPNEQSINEKIRSFEEAISIDTSEDPLALYIEYIYWLEQEVLVKGDKKSMLLKLLERCSAKFQDNPKYRNDPRYHKIWFRYANAAIDPTEIYNFMDYHGIALCNPIFYTVWATAMERKRNFQKAEEIFQLGIKRIPSGEKGKQVLLEYHKKFLDRVAQAQQEEDLEEPLSEYKLPLGQPGLPQRPPASSTIPGLVPTRTRHDNRGFSVFSDENTFLPGDRHRLVSRQDAQWNTLGPESERYKENYGAPGKWSDNPHRMSKRAAERDQPQPFSIFVEEQFRNPPEKSSSFRQKLESVDSYQKPSELQDVKQVPTSVMTLPESHPITECPNPTLEELRSNELRIDYADGAMRIQKSMYNRNFAWNDDGEEVSIEEVRAMFRHGYVDPKLTFTFTSGQSENKPQSEKPQPQEQKQDTQNAQQLPQIPLMKPQQVPPKLVLQPLPQETESVKFQPQWILPEQQRSKETSQATNLKSLPNIYLPSQTQLQIPPTSEIPQEIPLPTLQTHQPKSILRKNKLPDLVNPHQSPPNQENVESSGNQYTGTASGLATGVRPPSPQISFGKENLPFSVDKENYLPDTGYLEPPVQDITDTKSITLSGNLTINSRQALDLCLNILNADIKNDYTTEILIPIPTPMVQSFDIFEDPKIAQKPLEAGSEQFVLPSWKEQENFTIYEDPEGKLRPPENMGNLFISNDISPGRDDSSLEDQENKPPPGCLPRRISHTQIIEEERVFRPITDGTVAFDASYDVATGFSVSEGDDGVICDTEANGVVDITPNLNFYEQENQPPQDYPTNLARLPSHKAEALRPITDGRVAFDSTSDPKLYTSDTENREDIKTPSSPRGGFLPPVLEATFEIYEEPVSSRPPSAQKPTIDDTFDINSISFRDLTIQGESTGLFNDFLQALNDPPSINIGQLQFSPRTQHNTRVNQAIPVIPSFDLPQIQPDFFSSLLENEEIIGTTFMFNDCKTSYLDPYSLIKSKQDQLIDNLLHSSTNIVDYADLPAPEIECGKRVKIGAELEDFVVKGKMNFGTYSDESTLQKYLISQHNKSYILTLHSPPQPWEYYICKQVQIRLPLERRVTCPDFYCMVIHSNKSLTLEEFNMGVHVTLKDICDSQYMVWTQELAVFYMIEVLRLVKSIHQIKIIHGNIMPHSFILRPDEFNKASDWKCGAFSCCLQLVDFCHSLDVNSFPPGTTFYDSNANHQFLKVQSGQPWTYHVDLFGICGMAHYFLHAKPMEIVQSNGRWTISSGYKNWNKEVWYQLFDVCLNVEKATDFCQLLGSLQSLFEDWLVKNPRKSKGLQVQFKEQWRILGLVTDKKSE